MKLSKTLLLPLITLWCLLLGIGPALAQNNVRILFPGEGEQVRGEITVRFEGIPEGGYVKVLIDGKFRQATAATSFNINTFPPNFPDDGQHSLTVIGVSADGKPVGTATVHFQIANKIIDPNAPGLHFRVWVPSDRTRTAVQRYRIFAVSDAYIEGGAGGAAGGAGGGGGGGPGGMGGEEEEQWIPAPLDWQVSALVRRIVRDVGMVDGAANVRSIVQQAVQRQRESEGGTMAGGMGGPGAAAGGTTKKKKKKKKKGPTGPTKAPWKVDWETAPEVGLYFVKMLKQTGEEINATRKSPPIALGDLFPTFPEEEVHPGSTWESTMTFVTELSTREPLTVRAPVTFTSFESLKTPGGETRRTAKLESRFTLPEDQAKRVSIMILSKSGNAQGQSSLPVAGGMGTEGPDLEDIETARTRISRVLWFDIDNRRVLRSEDVVDTSFETAKDAEVGIGGAGGGGGGEGGGQTKVAYNLHVWTWYDDTLPPPNGFYNSGAGTAHGRMPGSRDQSLVEDPRVPPLTRP